MPSWEFYVLEKAASKIFDKAIGKLFDSLQEINRKLDLIVYQDFNVAIDYLDECLRHLDDETRKEDSLIKACKKFRESYGINDLWVQIISSYGMSVCYLLLDDINEFEFRSRQCVDDCQKLLLSLINEAYSLKHYIGYHIPSAFLSEFGDNEYEKFRDLSKEFAKNSLTKKILYSFGRSNTHSGVLLLENKRYANWKIKYFTCLNIIDAFGREKVQEGKIRL